MSERPPANSLPVQRVLHVVNYGWPYIDGYTVRSSGLITAQQRHLGLEVAVAVSPFVPLTGAQDPDFDTSAWHQDAQIEARRYGETSGIGASLRRLERPGLRLAPATRREFRDELTSIVRRLAPDVIHAHHPHYVGAVALEVARDFGLPCVYELRCFNGDYDLGRRDPYARLRGRLFNRHEARLCQAADAVVTISDGLARRIVANGAAAAQVHVVRNSFDGDRFAIASSPRDDSALRPVRRIGYACTFAEMEGLDLLVDAVAALPEDLRDRLKVVLAGDGADYERIATRVAERGLRETIELPGFVPYSEMPEFYANLDLFVIPRRPSPVTTDTTPLKPLEARAAGIPLLASDLPALKELLGPDAEDVAYVTPDAESFASALSDFLTHPWAGISQADDSRSWKNEVERYRAVYAGVASQASRASAASPQRLPVLETATRSSRRLLRRAVDTGAPGLTPLDTHVVICGFPRTGSTLLQLMIEACVADVRTFDGELEGLWAARYAVRNHHYMVSKYPRDITAIDALRAHYRERTGQVHFVVMLRDPRAILTSAHQAYPSSQGYYVDFERWQTIYEHVRALDTGPDVTFIRYEDLVTDPDRVQAALAEAIGWQDKHEFSRYDDRVRATGRSRDSMTEGALGGLRAVERGRSSPWLDPEHTERMQAMLESIPEMPEYLIELGYEPNRVWVNDFV
ncbi:glycosyltransferase [Salinisphaera sp. SPP-AMP-43]|uniref:glycosyltransferase n=1 Tax=Salinisphaera sp. SPP-AMP-43 TaxID=3121288 RepID=UPI003C6E95DB